MTHLRDGRALAYAEWGPAGGRPVLHFHGVPDGRFGWGGGSVGVQPFEGAGGHAIRSRTYLGRGQRLHRLDPALLQLGCLATPELGDEAQVIVGDSPLVTRLGPLAQLAVGDGIGVGPVEPVAESPHVELFHPSEVGAEVGVRKRSAFAIAEDYVDVIGLASLDRLDQVGVEAELDYEIGLQRTGELGVGRLIAPVAELRWRLDALEEVDIAHPVAVDECRLVDDGGAILHRLSVQTATSTSFS
ncbi:MAG: hypothetical protein WA687_05305 [Solirubrobacterales bacterium]